ncbi:MAG: secondary thiamine-phosphate synthase enzyme YjbQ [Saccharospirillum sp.]
MFWQHELQLPAKSRGFHLITDDINAALQQAPQVSAGLLHVLIKHTSASLTVNENADPAVRRDFERFFQALVPDTDRQSPYEHTYEGPDDLPAHFKASLLGCNLLLPVTQGRLNLGTWQGVYLGEHRDRASGRQLVLTLQGE